MAFPHRMTTLALAALLASGAAVQAQTPASASAATVQAGSYTVETHHTRVLFSVSHMGFSTWYGEFPGTTGTLTLDPKALSASRVDVTVPTAAISTSNSVLDGELRDPTWFDAAKYPTITFHSTAFRRTGASTADVTGDLTFHGVTKPVVLKARFVGAGVNPLDKAYTVGFDLTGTIKRSDFGVTKYVPLIGDDVTLILSAAFEKAK